MSDTSEIIQQCFEGLRTRACYSCLAHSSRGGDCCFGTYEDGHRQCSACPHRLACKHDTIRSATVHQPSRVSVSYGNSNPRVMGNRTVDTKNVEVPPMEGLPQESLDDFKRKSFGKRLGICAGWGAIEGSLTFVLGFFKSNRPF